MRLLHARSLRFQDFNESSPPPYAILSHTWDAGEEVTLQDMSSPYLASKKGYAKITETCRLALSQGLEYAWVDTCCIDKTSSAELTESINSMFRWYEKASVCYVYLSDLDTPTAGLTELAGCVWFQRGWTLQELLAPRYSEFYNKSWAKIGTKEKLQYAPSTITDIPVTAMEGDLRLTDYSTAQRMSWASKRVTTRVEDVAYCLLGLFDVHMPLIYGEGTKAFYRLQEEIIRSTVDLTLFSWLLLDYADELYCPLLAPSPAAFKQCCYVRQLDAHICEYSITNIGVKLTATLFLDHPPPDSMSRSLGSTYILPVGLWAPIQAKPCEIGIRIVAIGPGAFVRIPQQQFVGLDGGLDANRWDRLATSITHTFHILNTDDPWRTSMPVYPPGIHIPDYTNQSIIMTGDYSPSTWDPATRMHYNPALPYHVTAFSFVASILHQDLEFGILFDFRERRSGGTRCLVIDKRTAESRLFFLILMRSQSDPMSWHLIDQELPGFTKLTDKLEMESGGLRFNITASLESMTTVHLQREMPTLLIWVTHIGV